MTADREKLIERLEKLTGPDREVDRAIKDYLHESKTSRHAWPVLPPFTASIDAAMTLVPDGKEWAVWGEARPQARVYEAAKNGGILMGRSWECCEAASPAIALCIAALRTRSNLPTEES